MGSTRGIINCVFNQRKLFCLQGAPHGQTQIATSSDASSAPWNHPFDAHFAVRSPLGWPKLVMHIHQLDEVSANISCGANIY